MLVLDHAQWQQGFLQLGLAVTVEQQQRLAQYLALLVRWNKVHNLTAVRNEQQMLPLHIWDSLSVIPFLQGKTVLDVGSGAGLPGIPLAIMMPSCHFTLMDTNGKKTRFIQQAVLELGLSNIQVVQARVEEWQATAPFNAIISRAFASLSDFIQTSSRHLDSQGILYAMKGRYPQSELEALPSGWRMSVVHPLSVPQLDAERHLFEIIPTV